MAYVPGSQGFDARQIQARFQSHQRQIICFSLGALAGVPLFFLTKGAVGTSVASLLMIMAMIPFFMFAMYERHGQPLEVLLRHYMQARFVRPRRRIYQTENFYATIEENIRSRREVKKILHGKAH